MTPALTPPLTPLQLSTVENSKLFFISQAYFKDAWQLLFINLLFFTHLWGFLGLSLLHPNSYYEQPSCQGLSLKMYCKIKKL